MKEYVNRVVSGHTEIFQMEFEFHGGGANGAMQSDNG